MYPKVSGRVCSAPTCILIPSQGILIPTWSIKDRGVSGVSTMVRGRAGTITWYTIDELHVRISDWSIQDGGD